VTPLAPLLVLAAGLAQEPAGPAALGPAVAVERVLVDARVLDRGRTVRGLGPAAFRVRIDGAPADLVSVTWISAEGASPAVSSSAVDAAAAPEQGRLVVLLVQKDLHPTRTGGLLRMLDGAADLVEGLGPADRAAVLSFDTHLKLWRDFTADSQSLRRALEHDVLFETRARHLGPSPEPSIGAHLGLEASRGAATPEAGLRLIAEALREIPGSKTLIFLGHGLGQLSGPRVTFHEDYDQARLALLEASVTVFTLDVTDADRHSLEVGLQEIADDTGGFYARTHIFSRQAMSRLEEALGGHYVLEVTHPGGSPGRHELDVALVGVDGRVYARTAYFD